MELRDTDGPQDVRGDGRTGAVCAVYSEEELGESARVLALLPPGLALSSL